MQNFSNLQIHYSHGGLTTCGSWWGSSNIILPDSKFYYFTKGKARLVISGKRYTAQAGDLYLIPAGVRHSFYLIDNQPMTQYWFHFSAECQDVSVFQYLKGLPPFIAVGQDHQVRRLFENILKNAPCTQLLNLLEVHASILKLISFYIEKTNTSLEIQEIKTPLSETLSYINDNFAEPLTVQQLAKAAHLHPNYFIRLFKTVTGLTPARYIQKRRIDSSQQLLKYSHTSITEIMLQSGFTDLSHFSKVFKKECGYTPRQYRALFQPHQD